MRSLVLRMHVSRAPLALGALFFSAVPLGLPAAALSAQPAVRPAAVRTPAAPATAQHTAFIVATNKKGQVVTVRAERKDRDTAFNMMTYGNALQMFIRTADGRAIPGRYRVTYDYSPQTKDVKRSIALVAAGGVDPDALGAVDRMAALERQRAERAKQARKAAPLPIPTTAAR
jgi:hypothetical protein